MSLREAARTGAICTTAIGLGTVLYLGLRPDRLAVFAWAEGLGLRGPVDELRAAMAPAQAWIPELVINSVPGGLWAFAFALAMGRIWAGVPLRQSAPALAIVPLLALGSELGQWAGWVPGTADTLDGVAYVIGMAAGLVLAQPK